MAYIPYNCELHLANAREMVKTFHASRLNPVDIYATKCKDKQKLEFAAAIAYGKIALQAFDYVEAVKGTMNKINRFALNNLKATTTGECSQLSDLHDAVSQIALCRPFGNYWRIRKNNKDQPWKTVCNHWPVCPHCYARNFYEKLVVPILEWKARQVQYYIFETKFIDSYHDPNQNNRETTMTQLRRLCNTKSKSHPVVMFKYPVDAYRIGEAPESRLESHWTVGCIMPGTHPGPSQRKLQGLSKTSKLIASGRAGKKELLLGLIPKVIAPYDPSWLDLVHTDEYLNTRLDFTLRASKGKHFVTNLN